MEIKVSEVEIMEVKIIRGYGAERSAEEQQRYLEWLGDALRACDLFAISVHSERLTGGEIIIELPDCYSDRGIINSFLLLVTAQARKICIEQKEELIISLDMLLPGYHEPLTIMGTGY